MGRGRNEKYGKMGGMIFMIHGYFDVFCRFDFQ